MIELRHVSKAFGRIRVLSDVSVVVPRGCVTAVVGPNASGKTTLNRIILGLVRPDAGEVLFEGASVAGTSAYRAKVGYMRQSGRFPDNLRADDVIRLLVELRGNAIDRDDELVESLGIASVLGTPMRLLSGGTRQRINAALAFLFSPDLLILDEPTAALDPVSSSALKDKIRRERERGGTFIFTSHILGEVEELADRVVFLLDGGVRFAGEPSELLRVTGADNLERAVAGIMRGAGFGVPGSVRRAS